MSRAAPRRTKRMAMVINRPTIGSANGNPAITPSAPAATANRKGIRDLLAAIPTVLTAAPTTCFVLAGGARGQTAAQMDRWWRPSGLEGDPRVTFTGWLDAEEMAAWYGKADILVVPSWYEPFGMVVLEGMLHGLAIAAANVGGPSEILVDGVTGRLFPPRDVPALGQVLIELAGSRSVRRRLGRQARREVARCWAWPPGSARSPQCLSRADARGTKRGMNTRRPPRRCTPAWRSKAAAEQPCPKTTTLPVHHSQTVGEET